MPRATLCPPPGARLTYCEATSQPFTGRSGNRQQSSSSGSEVTTWTQIGGLYLTCSQTRNAIGGSAKKQSEKNAGPSSGAAKR